MKQSTYMVVYRDSPTDHVRLFGPFVASEVAIRFKDDLPTPLPGGSKSVKVTEPFTHDEADLVTDLIKVGRNG